LDLEPERSQTWQLGSPEGKKTNIRIMAVDLAKDDPRYHSLEERLRDFIACNMPEEAVQLQFEDDIRGLQACVRGRVRADFVADFSSEFVRL
jgi:hypothetical protein